MWFDLAKCCISRGFPAQFKAFERLFGLHEAECIEVDCAPSGDSYPVVRGEFVAMRLAKLAGCEAQLEMFTRLILIVLVGNTDDHARNHAAFWDGYTMELTPAYDIAPQRRSSRQANQAMTLTDGWAKVSQASALAMDFSQSFESRRHRPSQARVRSTTHRRGNTSKPCAVSERLTICTVQHPTAFSASRSLGPA